MLEFSHFNLFFYIKKKKNSLIGQQILTVHFSYPNFYNLIQRLLVRDKSSMSCINTIEAYILNYTCYKHFKMIFFPLYSPTNDLIIKIIELGPIKFKTLIMD